MWEPPVRKKRVAWKNFFVIGIKKYRKKVSEKVGDMRWKSRQVRRLC